MKINIETKTVLPVEIGDLKFEIKLDDEGLNKILNQYESTLEKMKAAQNGTIESANEGLKIAVDFFLGEGAYDKIYDKYKSFMVCEEITYQLFIEVAEELEQRNLKLAENAKAKKYLAKVKR